MDLLHVSKNPPTRINLTQSRSAEKENKKLMSAEISLALNPIDGGGVVVFEVERVELASPSRIWRICWRYPWVMAEGFKRWSMAVKGPSLYARALTSGDAHQPVLC
jgi:hypothetical protein